MFRNWINIHDLERLKDKICRGEWRQVAKKLQLDNQGKIRAAWNHTQNPQVNAWDIPALRRRWNWMVSGSAEIDHVEYISQRYLKGKKNLTAFSPGCGGGGNEIRWAETGLFERIDACDLSEPRIAGAKSSVEQKDLAGIVHFKVGDMRTVSGSALYDLVITEGSLHHFYPMHAALERIKTLLKPGGMLIVNDFVGPSRFQWTPRQLQAANAILDLDPPSLPTALA